ncbi:uncharacterized protein CDAR_444561 [Caerostris darwini]|uniref:Uncharacterized protein n=1 Tax=Caerostris darwini TaxID=1538125 RepID=A0AAV4W5L9_9ARAC|nr:uncharacterized protein CDAR_444561 [Caerostris darwini]
MADQTPNLLTSVPKIVITEPSPLLDNSNVENIGDAATATSTAIATEVTETTPETPTADPNVSRTTNDESGEFHDPVCNIYRDEERSSDVVMEVDAIIPEVNPERNDESEEFFRNMPSESLFDCCARGVLQFSESKYMLFIQFLLLSMPISSGFMGAKYLDKCPLSSETPVFLFMMGVAGTIVIICRILLISQKILLPRRREWQLLRVIMIVGNLAIIVCLATEMFSFFRISPSFEPGNPHYCHETFYNFTYWMNWACLIVVVVLALLQVPNCSVNLEGLQGDFIP